MITFIALVFRNPNSNSFCWVSDAEVEATSSEDHDRLVYSISGSNNRCWFQWLIVILIDVFVVTDTHSGPACGPRLRPGCEA